MATPPAEADADSESDSVLLVASADATVAVASAACAVEAAAPVAFASRPAAGPRGAALRADARPAPDFRALAAADRAFALVAVACARARASSALFPLRVLAPAVCAYALCEEAGYRLRS